jgi:hypothetical protein
MDIDDRKCGRRNSMGENVIDSENISKAATNYRFSAGTINGDDL